MEITLYRDREISRETHRLPAVTYNLAHTLLARSPSGCLFVPIRSMQYLAVLDRVEFVFVDSQLKQWVEIAWQHFQPQSRTTIGDPVPYEAVIYHPDGRQHMTRLLGEFPKALQALADRARPDGPARVLKFEARRPPDEP